MLWARVADKRQRDPHARIVHLTTFGTPTSALTDLEIVFKPNTDLAIWNFIAREIVTRKRIDHVFVDGEER